MAEISVVAERLKEARIRAGISQKQLGIMAGIDSFSASPRINQYERGKHEPDLRTLTRLATVLEVPVAYFYSEDPELAQVIAGFAKLKKAQRKRVLALLSDITV
jgi:transcriptional regulator with XRE-family HTH domain